MSNKYKRKYQKKETKLWQDILLLLPVLLGLCVVPLIVLTHDFTIDFTEFNWFNTTPLKNQIDSFGHGKSVALVMAGIIAVVICSCHCWFTIDKKNISLKKYFSTVDKKVAILLGIHLLMVIISSIASKYKDLVFNGGGYNQWQTMWALLSYGILFFFAYFMIDSKRKVNIVYYGLMIHLAIMAHLGFMQSIGKNPLLQDWLQKIITKYSKFTGISFSKDISDVILTFYNPNYSGTFVALMLPVAIAFIFVNVAKKLWLNILFKLAGIAVVAGFIKTIIGSGSSAAGLSLVCVAIIAGFFILVSFFEMRNYKWWISATCIIIIGIFGSIGALQTDYVKTTIDKLTNGTKDTRNLVSIVNETPTRMQVNFRNGESFDLDVSLEENSNATFKITDTSGKDIPLTWNAEQEIYIPQDERFNMLSFEPKRYGMDGGIKDAFIISDVPNGITFTFMYDNNEWKYYTPYGKLIKLHAVERFGFQNSENMANRRGYIWSRTIPLMKTYWFKGIGPNAFIIAFPNDDFVGSKRVGGGTLLVDKPHNTFLQIFIQTGGISAITYAALCFMYIIQCIRLFWRKKLLTNIDRIAFGVFMSTISYTIVCLTNDAVIGVQSSYWILLGFGYAINSILKKNVEVEPLSDNN